MDTLYLYHGSTQTVPQPDIQRCRPRNDYGQGFYCTADKELAREWACQKQCNGFVSCYELSLSDLTILDLNGTDYSILHWLEVLLTNRLVHFSTPLMHRGALWLHENFSVDTTSADIIHGYRADDSYFVFARAFLRNEITFGQLESALYLGELGTQYMIKSPRAFQQLHYTGYEIADASLYWPRQAERDHAAREAFSDLVLQDFHGDGPHRSIDSLYLSDLMKLEEGELDDSLR